jgi:hypothetical protein
MEALKHGARPPAVKIPTFFTFLFIKFCGGTNLWPPMMLQTRLKLNFKPAVCGSRASRLKKWEFVSA